jgi:hypothetical protein
MKTNWQSQQRLRQLRLRNFRAQAMVISRNERSPTSSERQLIRQIETKRMIEEGSSIHTSGLDTA